MLKEGANEEGNQDSLKQYSKYLLIQYKSNEWVQGTDIMKVPWARDGLGKSICHAPECHPWNPHRNPDAVVLDRIPALLGGRE